MPQIPIEVNCQPKCNTPFGILVFQTCLVAAGTMTDWIAQFAFGFYSIMLTSTIIGFVVNVLFRPGTWCSFCPMGIMTQMICKLKAKEKL